MTAAKTKTVEVLPDEVTAEKGGVDTSGPIAPTVITDDGDNNLVDVVLAHPITKDADKDYLGVERDHKCNVGDTIKVTRDAATSLINAGYAQVDPEDYDAVRVALGVEPSA